jgi:ABC-2 type transport system permease protein
MRTMQLMLAFVRRDALSALSYRAAFLMPLLAIFFAVPVLYFLAKAASPDGAGHFQAYSGSFFAFVLLGIAFQDYVTLSMSSFMTSLREHQLMGTMEIVMLSPTPAPLILLFSSVWGYLFTSLRFALYIGLGLWFGLDLSSANLVSFALLTALAIVSFAALGILCAAIGLIIKQGSSVVALLSAATLALSGVFYPVSSLPGWLQNLAQVLPFTHALEGVRKALLAGATPTDLGLQLLILAAFGAVLFPLALYAFELALRRVKATGTLGQY